MNRMPSAINAPAIDVPMRKRPIVLTGSPVLRVARNAARTTTGRQSGKMNVFIASIGSLESS
jgi:hypothetical protein